MRTAIKPILAYLFPRLHDALFLGVLLAVLLQGNGLLNADGDLGRHITIGKYILTNRDIPTRDIFSHTMTGERLVPHEWLAQLTFGGIHTLLGLSGVVLLISILIAATFTLTCREMVGRNVFRIPALLVSLLAAYASSIHWIARPHIFTFLFAALWTYQLENEKAKAWIFPLLMLIWANTHGAFIAGFVIWGAHAAGWLWEYVHKQTTKETGIRLGVIGAASFAVTFINPAGWHLWETSVGYFGSRFLVDQTIEYQSPNFHNWSTWPFLIMLTLSLFALGFGGRLRPYQGILLAGWAVLSLYSARNIPLFAIIAAPYLGILVQPMLGKVNVLQRLDRIFAKVEDSLRGSIFPILAILFLASYTLRQPHFLAANHFNPDKFPVAAVDWIETHPQDGNMFNNFIWGGYLLYRLWPQYVVFIDGQTDFYGETLTREYMQVMSLEDGWESVLEKYDVGWVIVQSDKPLVNALREQWEWEVAYRDDTATVLRKP